ncbi:MAG: SGNH/GDSL hydrolase family protein [Sphingobacteriales bacterium JAD_PAG50586_3]|nr:MAG: SGNH/GDSL hydrolase family protein [Sphingobacteriales bacterium JAD_PAG50586_3]
MNIRLLLFLALLGVSARSFSQCAENPQPKVLLVGDSWAFFMSVDQTINTVFSKWGHSDCTFYTNITLAENGAETDDFLTPAKQNEILAKLDEYPSIEFIHLSIGGNDALGDWNINYTQGQTDTLIEDISQRLLDVITFIKTARPNIKVFWSGYVYPNFGEVIETSFLGENHPFFGTWDGMGQPTFQQINDILNVFSHRAEVYADTTDNVDYVSCPGLLQYTFGQPDPLGVAPGGSYAAFTQPLPFGDPSYPSPKESMRDYGLTKDCFHLSPRGYRDFIGYHTRKFYHKALMHDFYAVADSIELNGSLSANGSVSDLLKLGELDSGNYASLLTFNLATMADTGITKASLFIRREELAGATPVNGAMQVKIKAGYFGGSILLETADLLAQPSTQGAPCIFGANQENGDWVRLELPEYFYPYLQTGNTVQFILEAPTATGSILFSNATEPDFAPVLDITYGPKTVSVVEVKNDVLVDIYPNPTTGLLNINTTLDLTNTTIQIHDITGRLMLSTVLTGTTVDVAALPAGIYSLQLITPKGTFNKKIVRN